jgi:putative ABC transport system permease protein
MSFSLLELFNRVRDRFRRDALGRELDEELRFHQTMLERDAQALGDPHAARRSRIQLGNTTYIKEETRAMWSLGWFDDFLQDLRYAGRVLRHNLAFTAAIVLTLALGIGANTAIFSVVNAVLLQPLPYAQPDRLYSIWTVPSGSPNDRNPVSFPILADWRQQNSVFEDIGGYAFNRYELAGSNGADMVRAIISTPSVYHVLGANPMIGRLPRDDEAQIPVMAISHRVWLHRFGGDRSVIGTKVILGDKPFTIVGVMAPGFHFPTPDIDLWLSLAAMSPPANGGPNPWITGRAFRGWRTVARLKPGVTAAAAESQMNDIMRRLGEANPNTDAGFNLKLQSVREDSVRNIQRALWFTLGAAGLVLLLACANVAHLMLARLSSRTREIAIRRALGAHRSRVVRQLLTESVVLGLIGGVAGLLVAMAGIRVLVRLSPGDIPRLENIAIDPATLLFATAASLLTGLLFGIAPTIVAWRGGAGGDTLREHVRGGVGGHGTRARSLLTVAEVAFAMMLLIGAGLMVRSFASLLSIDPGFRVENVTTFQIGFANSRYPNPADQSAALNRVIDRLQAIPGVTLAGASTSLPPTRMQQASGFSIEGEPQADPGKGPMAIFVPATAQFIPALGIPLVEGRQFTAGDDGNAPPVALISRELAHRFFRDRSPVGRRFSAEGATWTIVGVVGDVSYRGIDKPAEPVIYVPFAQSPFGGTWVAVKSTVPAQSLAQPIRDAIHAVDPTMNARELRSMDETVSDSMVRPRFQTWLLVTFGGLALMLAAIGIYGVIAYGVAQRTPEIGLRLALGAPPRSVVGGIMRRGMMPVGAGLVIGLGGAFALSRVMRGLLYGITTTDLPTFVSTAGILTCVALAAAFLPARRAARLDPLKAIRDG